MTEVSEPEFVRVCTLDPELGTLVTKIYRWGDSETPGSQEQDHDFFQVLHRLLVLLV